MKLPRLFGLFVLNLILMGIIFATASQQIPVTLYKSSLVTVAGLVGYCLDRTLFPYARPGSFLKYMQDLGFPHAKHQDVNLAFCASMLRRAIIVGCAMLAMGLGA